jgi:hypothetical protein
MGNGGDAAAAGHGHLGRNSRRPEATDRIFLGPAFSGRFNSRSGHFYFAHMRHYHFAPTFRNTGLKKSGKSVKKEGRCLHGLSAKKIFNYR